MLDIDQRWLAEPLADTLNQTDAGFAVQIGHEPYCFSVSAIQTRFKITQRILDIHPAQRLKPAVPGRRPIRSSRRS